MIGLSNTSTNHMPLIMISSAHKSAYIHIYLINNKTQLGVVAKKGTSIYFSHFPHRYSSSPFINEVWDLAESLYLFTLQPLASPKKYWIKKRFCCRLGCFHLTCLYPASVQFRKLVKTICSSILQQSMWNSSYVE